MTLLSQIAQELESCAPLRLAETWDNVGLLVGDRRANVERVMTCLTVTPTTLAEAIRERAELIVAHHPLPFRPLQRINTDNTVGRMLLDVIAARISVYSLHTAFDSCAAGINRRLAEAMQLVDIKPLVPKPETNEESLDLSGGEMVRSTELIGAGRCGRLAEPLTLGECAARLRAFLQCGQIRGVGSADQRVTRVGVACGSGGDFLSAARRRGCDCLITGEANFHACLEAEAQGMGLLLAGHFASERFAMEDLATHLSTAFPTLTVWPSRDERDPVQVF